MPYNDPQTIAKREIELMMNYTQYKGRIFDKKETNGGRYNDEIYEMGCAC